MKYIIIKNGIAVQANAFSDIVRDQFYSGADVYQVDGRSVYKLESKGVWSLLKSFEV